ncbi:molybdopterin dinucleotide binding domain-containing protein [Streptomyces sp. NPDC048420]|uniref:molybdopterin dinucleotide binding domain-containing protein n=1 Tax=Streptomyces sp. NPDC048420 TaxID=3155755 RepID=UPI00343463E1
MTELGTHAIGADARLRPNVGTELPMAHAIGREIIQAGLADREFTELATSGYEEYRTLVEPWTLSLAVKVTGVPAAVLRELAHAFAQGEPIPALAVTEHDTDGHRALGDLSLLTGRDLTGHDLSDRERRTRFQLVRHPPPVDLTDERYPVRLTNGRRQGSYNTLLQKGGSASALRRAECVELSPEDAERHGVVVGEVVRVVTRRGSTTAPVWVDPALRPGLAFMTGRSLAVDLATETGLPLVGFLRGHSMNVYAGDHRLALTAAAAAQG